MRDVEGDGAAVEGAAAREDRVRRASRHPLQHEHRRRLPDRADEPDDVGVRQRRHHLHLGCEAAQVALRRLGARLLERHQLTAVHGAVDDAEAARADAPLDGELRQRYPRRDDRRREQLLHHLLLPRVARREQPREHLGRLHGRGRLGLPRALLGDARAPLGLRHARAVGGVLGVHEPPLQLDREGEQLAHQRRHREQHQHAPRAHIYHHRAAGLLLPLLPRCRRRTTAATATTTARAVHVAREHVTEARAHAHAVHTAGERVTEAQVELEAEQGAGGGEQTEREAARQRRHRDVAAEHGEERRRRRPREGRVVGRRPPGAARCPRPRPRA